MSLIVIDLPVEIRKRLEDQARTAGQSPEIYMREMLEYALQTREQTQTQPQTVREVLIASDRARPLSDTLQGKIIPGVTLDEVRTSLTQADGPTLSETILKQREPKT